MNLANLESSALSALALNEDQLAEPSLLTERCLEEEIWKSHEKLRNAH